MLKSYRFWLGLVISAVSLFFAFQGIDLARLEAALTRFNWIWLAPAYLAFALSYVGRVFRWQLLFSPIHIRWRDVLSALSVGYFLSGIFPARIGDIARAYLVSTRDNVGIGRALSSVVIERLSDGLATVLFLGILLPFIPIAPIQFEFNNSTFQFDVRSFGFLVTVIALATVVALFLIAWQRERGLGLLRRLSSPIPMLQNEKVWKFAESILDGLKILHDPSALFRVSVWSLVVWFFAAVLNWLIMPAMGIPLGLDAATLVLVVTALAVIIPSSPGYIGWFHVVAQTTLVQFYNVDKTLALAYAVVIHAFVYLNLVALGVIFIWREGLSVGQLRQIDTTTETA